MNIGNLGLQVLSILSPLALAGLSWLVAKVTELIKAKTAESTLRNSLLRLNGAVDSVTRSVQQVTVDSIKSTSADGRLTTDQQTTVKQGALAEVKSYLGTRGLEGLAASLELDKATLDAFIATRIEAAVHDLKLERATVSGGTVGEHAPARV